VLCCATCMLCFSCLLCRVQHGASSSLLNSSFHKLLPYYALYGGKRCAGWEAVGGCWVEACDGCFWL
jgi:hypothetical protein